MSTRAPLAAVVGGTVFWLERHFSGMERQTISVSGMSCDGCERTVESALTNLESVSRVEADHENETVEVVVDEGVTEDDLHAAVREAGYEVPGTA
ncbi:heavy-metal-associated domain-containing protein [Natrinema amylolyticum]|uniref:heavy-metal-associated domain-containing protein n=1 Tax=Natrinema amylolyticum TaxID=2878679 RepID=UPI001CFC3040|nr:heavy-metal-associated domain-containing protein [Natrinema amylolyticum]